MKIKQIIPADGWGFIWTIEDLMEVGFNEFVAWALVEYEDGKTEVRGIMANNVSLETIIAEEISDMGFKTTQGITHKSEVKEIIMRIRQSWHKNENVKICKKCKQCDKMHYVNSQ